jgi:hypothetical protein
MLRKSESLSERAAKLSAPPTHTAKAGSHQASDFTIVLASHGVHDRTSNCPWTGTRIITSRVCGQEIEMAVRIAHDAKSIRGMHFKVDAVDALPPIHIFHLIHHAATSIAHTLACI